MIRSDFQKTLFNRLRFIIANFSKGIKRYQGINDFFGLKKRVSVIFRQ